MDKKLILGIGILVLAGFGYLYVTNQEKNKKTKAEADEKAQANLKAISDAAEKKRQDDLARMNDPQRKKLYDEIYLALVEQYKKMQDYMKANQSNYGGQWNLGMGNMNDVNRAANTDYTCLTDELNKMSTQQLGLALKVTKMKSEGESGIVNDPFLFREIQDFITQFPKIGADHPCDYGKPKEAKSLYEKTPYVGKSTKNV